MDNELTRHDLEAKIVKRCWENEDFRLELVSDPAGTFSKYLNVQRSALPTIVAHEEAAGTWHIVLPARPVNAAELSDEDLEQVAGGVTPTVLFTIALSIGLGVSGAVSGVGAISMKKGW